ENMLPQSYGFVEGGFGLPAVMTYRRTPKVEFRQVRGHATDIGAGTWGQPGSTADGSATMLSNGDADINGSPLSGVKYGAARSIIVITAPGNHPGGCCNTPISNSAAKESNNAGELS